MLADMLSERSTWYHSLLPHWLTHEARRLHSVGAVTAGMGPPCASMTAPHEKWSRL
jgi:hypothetical protein